MIRRLLGWGGGAVGFQMENTSGYVSYAAGNRAGLSSRSLNRNLNFLRPPHLAIPAITNTVPTLPSGQTTVPSLPHPLVEGPEGPLPAFLNGRGSVAEQIIVCRRAALEKNDGNSFGPETQISFRLPHAGKVDGSIFNQPGQEARRSAGGELSSGEYTNLRDGKDAGGPLVTGGIHFYRLESRDFVTTMRVFRL